MTMTVNSPYTKLVRVRAVKPLSDFRVHVTFTDDSERDIDLEPYLHGPVFEPIRNDPSLFASVFVDPIGKTLAWPNEVDIDPDTLYYGDNPPWAVPAPTRTRATRALDATATKRRSISRRKATPQRRRAKMAAH